MGTLHAGIATVIGSNLLLASEISGADDPGGYRREQESGTRLCRMGAHRCNMTAGFACRGSRRFEKAERGDANRERVCPQPWDVFPGLAPRVAGPLSRFAARCLGEASLISSPAGASCVLTTNPIGRRVRCRRHARSASQRLRATRFDQLLGCRGR